MKERFYKSYGLKRAIMAVLILSVAITGFSDWLVEVKVEGMEYEHNEPLELALLLDTLHNDVEEYDNADNYLWKTAENPKGKYNVERWDQLKDLITSLLYREGYNFVGIYTKNWTNGNTLIPYIFIENRFSEPDEVGNPENFVQRDFDLVKNESVFTKAFNEGKGYFTTNIRRVIESDFNKDVAEAYQKKAGVRGYFAYPLKNGEITIGLLIVATKEPGITEEQYFRIEQYADAAQWLVLETADLLAHPEKLGYSEGSQ